MIQMLRGIMGILKKPVKFRIHKLLYGISREYYRDGILTTKDRQLIAQLRRLPKDHCEEIAPELVQAVVEDATIPEKWSELKRVGFEKGLYKVGMTRAQLLEALQCQTS
jgi:hypothetical protein